MELRLLPNRFFIVMCFISSIQSFAVVKPSSHPDMDRSSIIAETARQIATEYHNMGWFSGNVLVAKDGKAFFTQSFGYQDIENKIQNSISSKFNLGSVIKHFTKVLVLQQVELGTLSLKDKLEKFELGFNKEISSKIIIEDLLNHRSGFADIFVAKYRENQLSFDTLDKKLQLLMNTPLRFEPGSDFLYSNYGYIVLGAVLEKVTMHSYEQLLVHNIFKPIGLDNTSFSPNHLSQNQSVRYTYNFDGSIKRVGVTEHPGPDGGIESTVEDVQRFYRELFYGSKLLDKTNPLVRKAFAMNGEHWGAYGGGLGVSAAVEVDLLNGYEVVVLANTDKLVAELISSRIHSFIKEKTYKDIRTLDINFAYSFYIEHGKEGFYKDFKSAYKANGYSQFIGRTINELGMQLLTVERWNQAFDFFNYLISIFPDAPQAYDSLAFAHLTKGEKSAAKKAFQKALDINPNFKSEYNSANFGL